MNKNEINEINENKMEKKKKSFWYLDNLPNIQRAVAE